MRNGNDPIGDYVEVAERIRQFYERYPDGRLTRLDEPKVLDVGGRTFVVYTALAYRSPDDPLPATGTAWEPFPGPTPFTRDSELMNAETAAWGRAIVAAGIAAKRIASREEVGARQPSVEPRVAERDAGEVSELARRLVTSGVWDSRRLTREFVVGAGATDTTSLDAAARSLSQPAAEKLLARMRGLAQSGPADVEAPAAEVAS